MSLRRAFLGCLAVCLVAAAPPPTARRTPRVLAPAEGGAALARVGVQAYVLDPDPLGPPRPGRPVHVGVVEGPAAKGKEAKVTLVPLDELPGIVRSPEAERLRRRLRGAPFPAKGGAKKVWDNPRLAERPRPLRAAVLAASFPYRAQVEEFRKSLRLRDDAAVLRERAPSDEPAFRFLGALVQRRALDARGKPLTAYRNVNLQADFRPWLLVTDQRFEAEPAGLEPLTFPGLVMPRPKALSGRYPEPEAGLPTLRQAGRELAGGKPGEVLPRHCLLRVLDVSVEPGRTYQYRIRVRMAHPDPAPGAGELTSPWYELPRPVAVPAGVV